MRKRMMRHKHNKKRNTAFLYEVLVKELTKAVVSKNNGKKSAAVSIIRKHFKKGSTLDRDLQLYKSLSETTSVEKRVAEKILHEAHYQRKVISGEGLYDAQSELINDVNQELSPSVFGNFVPNYKYLATISQMFDETASIKSRVMLESNIIDKMSSDAGVDNLQPISNLTYRTFAKKFNDAYDGLHEEQKEILKRYVFSATDNGIALKTYLNEEIGRLRKAVIKSKKTREIKNDKSMLDNTDRVLEILNSFKDSKINEEQIRKVLKIQELAREVIE